MGIVQVVGEITCWHLMRWFLHIYSGHNQLAHNLHTITCTNAACRHPPHWLGHTRYMPSALPFPTWCQMPGNGWPVCLFSPTHCCLIHPCHLTQPVPTVPSPRSCGRVCHWVVVCQWLANDCTPTYSVSIPYASKQDRFLPVSSF